MQSPGNPVDLPQELTSREEAMLQNVVDEINNTFAFVATTPPSGRDASSVAEFLETATQDQEHSDRLTLQWGVILQQCRTRGTRR